MMSDFPIQAFFAELETAGFKLKICDYQRVALALGAGGKWTLKRLRTVLASLIAKNQEERFDFCLRFDSFFDTAAKRRVGAAIDVQEVLEDIKRFGVGGKDSDWRGRRGVFKRLRSGRDGSLAETGQPFSLMFVVTVAVCTIIGTVILDRIHQPQVQPVKVVEGQGVDTVRESEETGTAKKPVKQEPGKLEVQKFTNVPYVKRIVRTPIKGKNIWKSYAWSSLILFLILSFYSVWLWKSRKVPRDKPPFWDPDPDRPRRFSLKDLGGKPSPRLSRNTLSHLADSMGCFKSEAKSGELNVPASIEATCDNGIPRPVWRQRRRIRKLIILEDMFSRALLWNPVAKELKSGMERLGVPVLYARFRGSPEIFFTEDGKINWLEDLDADRDGCVLLIFSDGKGLSGRGSRYVLESLARWPMIAWMELRTRDFWDESSELPAKYVPIFPADEKGLLRAFDRFLSERSVQRDFSRDARDKRGIPARGEKSLGMWLEEILKDALPLAQACSLIRPVGFGLIGALRRRFYPEVPADAVERILAIPRTAITNEGALFSDRVSAVLRKGFLARLNEQEQEAVLKFLLKEMDGLEPDDKGSPAHLAWEWKRERLRLELEPDAALKRLSELSGTHLGNAVKGDMENVVLPGLEGVSGAGAKVGEERRLELRKPPSTRNGRQRLGMIAENCGVPTLEVYPVARKHLVALCLGVLFLLAGFGMSVVEYVRGGGIKAEIEVVAGDTGFTADISGWSGGGNKWSVPQGAGYQLVLKGKNVERRVDLGMMQDNCRVEIGSKSFQDGKTGVLNILDSDGGRLENHYVTLENQGITLTAVSGLPVEIPEGGWRVWIKKNHEGYYKSDPKEINILANMNLKIDFVIPIIFVNQIGMEFVLIKAGSFMMGSPENEPGRYDDEGPVHRVTLTEDFYMQTTEVTQGQWKAIIGTNPSSFKDCGDNCPVDNVSWNDIQEFIKKLNNKEKRGVGYSLPTEAQWEYAARAGTDTPFGVGDGKCLSTDQANYRGTDPMPGCEKGEYRKKTIPVASLAKNSWGLYDMHGNVWEWCQDWRGKYPTGDVVNPKGPSSGSSRVLRGGSWFSFAGDCRASIRLSNPPAYRDAGGGFRLALPQVSK